MRFPSLHKLHAQKYKTSLSHRFMQCSGKPGRWVIFHIPFCAVSARGATAEPPGRAASTTYFNSRPCERGDPDAALSAARFFRFQFTPLREGRRNAGQIIGAPSISIHAPARGATGRLPGAGCPACHFNSRPCERGDGISAVALADAMIISIHAPARGATETYTGQKAEKLYFNSRPCERGDHGQITGTEQALYFNSRPCERGDMWIHQRP